MSEEKKKRSAEEKKKRSVEEIRNEYGQLCAKAGHVQYQIAVLSDDLKFVNEQLKELNFEAAKAAQEAPKKEEKSNE